MESPQICQTCEKVTSNRCAFEAPLHVDKLRNISCKNFLDDPVKKVKWATKIYGEWRDHRHSLGLEIIHCDLDDLSTITEENVKFAFI